MTTKQTHENGDTNGLVRIGELARRAGVPRGTIQHYLREGLLPKPVKTFRNMAYYKPECVDRIRAIKELQAKSHLPLSRIREVMSSDLDSGALARAVVEAQGAILSALTPAARAGALTMKEAAKEFAIKPKVLDELVALRIVSARKRADGARVFTGADLEVLGTLRKLNELGFNEKSGFRPRDLLMYREALDGLIQREVGTFIERVASKKQGVLTPELARGAVDGATLLILALRKKSVADYLSTALAQLS